jgi:hypothetical protein
MKKLVSNMTELRLEEYVIMGMGKISVISTSKMRNTMAMRKNRREKGIREEFIGLNPHSNAEGFSRSEKFFFAIIELIIIKMMDTVMDIINSMIIA